MGTKSSCPFQIEHWHTNDRNKRAEPTKKIAYFDPSAVTGTIYDMKPFTDNHARIYAYSGGGDGPPSETRTFRMPEGCKYCNLGDAYG